MPFVCRRVRLPSVLLIGILFIVLWQSGRRRLAILWFAALVAVDLVEFTGKVTIAKPAMTKLRDGDIVPVGFHHSFPSGHVGRAAILGAAATCIWPRFWPVFLAWVAGVIVTADLDAIHTPSDLTGGALLAAVIFAVLAIDKVLFDRSSRGAAPGKARRLR